MEDVPTWPCPAPASPYSSKSSAESWTVLKLSGNPLGKLFFGTPNASNSTDAPESAVFFKPGSFSKNCFMLTRESGPPALLNCPNNANCAWFDGSMCGHVFAHARSLRLASIVSSMVWRSRRVAGMAAEWLERSLSGKGRRVA